MKTSSMFRLNWQDLLKAVIIATLSPVVPIIENSLSAGTFTMDWHNILIAMASGFFAYLIKNFLTPSKIIQDVPTDGAKQ